MTATDIETLEAQLAEARAAQREAALPTMEELHAALGELKDQIDALSALASELPTTNPYATVRNIIDGLSQTYGSAAQVVRMNLL